MTTRHTAEPASASDAGEPTSPSTARRAGTFLRELLIVVVGAQAMGALPDVTPQAPVAAAAGLTNTQALGGLIYTRYVLIFQAAGMVLLTAMVGAIVLTLRQRPGTRRQNIGAQVSRTGSISMERPPTGAGIKTLGIRRPPEPEAEAPKGSREW